MAYTTIDNPAEYFNTLTWTGNGSSPRTLTGVGFKPDFSWTKRRDGGQGNTNHNLYNNVSGAGNNSELASNTTGVEGGSSADLYGYLSAFTSDGFTLTNGTDGTYYDLYTNNSGGTYVAWNWLASNTTTANTSGTISSTVSVNTTAGFSVVSYTGNGSAAATVGHGLSVQPKIVIVKSRSAGGNWMMYNGSGALNSNQNLALNSTLAADGVSMFSDGIINPSSVTSSVFGFTAGAGGLPGVNGNTVTYIAYCFADVKGYSKFGSYTGNGSADGTFVYTGFKPAFVLWKVSSTTEGWYLVDNKRDTYNPSGNYLLPNTSATESGANSILDLLSNGFKFRSSGGAWWNGSGATYIYMAFAENPFVTSGGIPVTAR